ncbi:hypothetical protein [Conservatibacter flavescens]|uniref:Uncharacterized protein n=1 Tax=Conservatibacter flavescens TaxID=28161 RepID=A0A2M8S4Z1_9PAST|nr:hypothetical protein [Conservatibacter flavescens]PJG86212.1 hypothetical protein CVP05_03305 [Conservatibacter flavescens]
MARAKNKPDEAKVVDGVLGTDGDNKTENPSFEEEESGEDIATEDGGVVTKATVYKLLASHPTGSYWRGGVHFTRGVEVEVNDLDWSVEQIEEMLNDSWLECVRVVPMSKAEYEALKAGE